MTIHDQDSYARSKTATVLSGLGQCLVTLPDTNKGLLLSEVTQLTHSDESRNRAAAILSRLKELNPEVARQFHPKLNALSDISLRMVCPTEHDTQPLTGAISSYIAVSYCWHYPQWPLALAATPVSPGWEISEPMVKAVMELRHPDEGVWIDKLCINQDDEADKVTHIGVMDAIYRSARRVAILLEDVQLDQREEDAGLTYKGFYEDLCQTVKETGLEGEEKAQFVRTYFPGRENNLNNGHLRAAGKAFAVKLLSARWFSRGWCAHESRMTKHEKINNPVFFCFGADGRVLSFEFRFVHYLGMYLAKYDAEQEIASVSLINKMDDSAYRSLQQLGWRIQRLMPDSRETVSALQHLVSVLSFGCLKKGDLISIALNTAGIPLYCDGEGVQGIEEVIWKFTVLVLAAGDVIPLVATGPQLRIPSPGGQFISWAVHPDQPLLDDRLENPLPGSITAVTREYIEMDLLVFESLPQRPSPESQAKATRLITEHNLESIADDIFSAIPDYAQATLRYGIDAMIRAQPTRRPLQTLLHLHLSLALDNGLDWTLAFPDTILQTSAAWMYGLVGDQAHPSLTAAVHSFLALFTNTDDTSPSPESHHTPPLISTLPPDQLLSTLHRALTTLLDPRLLFLTPNPRRLPLSPSLGTAALTQSVSNRSYIAIPTALARLPGHFDRAWVVEPFDPATLISSTSPDDGDDAKAREEEEVKGYLADPEGVRLVMKQEAEGPGEVKIEDVVPVLSSDNADRRAPRDDTRGAWRVRERVVLFGCVSGPGGLGLWEDRGREVLERGGDGMLNGGEGLVLLRRQRVYGGGNYPWTRMNAAMQEAIGDAVAGGAGDDGAK